METYKDLRELFEARKNDGPDALLARISAFFEEAGSRYREGQLSEEAFYLATYYGRGFGDASLYERLWETKGVFVDQRQLSRVKAFRTAWTAWKRDGAIPEEPWARQCVRSSGSLADAVEWVFRVIDVCKVPLCAFDAIPISDVGVFPRVMWTQDGGEAWIVFTPKCLDDGGLLRDPAPRGKTCRLRFEGGITASLTVKTAAENGQGGWRYTCVGTVSDYVETPQELRLETVGAGELALTFGRRAASEWRLVSHTALVPIPHSKWAKFNEVHFAFSLRRETEYRILRLPYLLGGAADAPAPQGAENGARKPGRIVKLF